MPELPEVETIVRGLRKPLAGQTIVEVRHDWPRHIAAPEPSLFRQRIRGQQVTHISRRGKYLVFDLNGGPTLIIHLKMSGQLFVAPANEPVDQYMHTIFVLANGHELRFRDVRKFGKVYLVDDPDDILGELGPEPLEPGFTAEWLHENLKERRRILKPLLLDQTFIAGIGNIYADEALHHARINPMRLANTLSQPESEALHAGIQKTLKAGIAGGGATLDDYRKPDGSRGEMQNEFVAYGRAGQPCYRCGTPMERIVLGGRSTHFCPVCQALDT